MLIIDQGPAMLKITAATSRAVSMLHSDFGYQVENLSHLPRLIIKVCGLDLFWETYFCIFQALR